MAKKRITETESEPVEDIAPPETPGPATEPEPESVPIPILNRGPHGWVKVRATAHIGEPDRTGSIIHHKPGDVFEVTFERAFALAGLTTRV